MTDCDGKSHIDRTAMKHLLQFSGEYLTLILLRPEVDNQYSQSRTNQCKYNWSCDFVLLCFLVSVVTIVMIV